MLYNRYETLPRPTSWMPGPPAPWSDIDPSKRTIDLESLKAAINQIQNETNFTSKIELPQSAIENLGDNDVITEPSAVLVPLKVTENRLDSVLVMTRSIEVTSHKGQVSFPGGMVEKQDRTLEETALRETNEEIGISSDNFEIIGRLNNVTTKSQEAQITPVVAIMSSDINQYSINPGEVEQVHEIKIEELLKPDTYFCEIWDFGAIVADIHMYFATDVRGNKVFIWGATAHVLTELLHCSLKASVR